MAIPKHMGEGMPFNADYFYACQNLLSAIARLQAANSMYGVRSSTGEFVALSMRELQYVARFLDAEEYVTKHRFSVPH